MDDRDLIIIGLALTVLWLLRRGTPAGSSTSSGYRIPAAFANMAPLGSTGDCCCGAGAATE